MSSRGSRAAGFDGPGSHRLDAKSSRRRADRTWSEYLTRVGRGPKRLFEDAAYWNDIKQVVRSNDRTFGPRPGAADSREGDLSVFLDEFTLFFQSHLYGEAQLLTRIGVTADEVERHFARNGDLEVVALAPNEEVMLELPADLGTLEAMCLENRSANRLTGCELIVNGRSWRDLDAITRTLLGPGDDPSDLAPDALAHTLLWAFRAAVTHAPKQLDQKRDPLARHPVAFFNYFGQSTCGVLSYNFAAICAHLGLRARVRKNACHTFCELHLDGAWRILDPDPAAEAHYPASEDARRLLGAEELWDCEPGIHERVKLPAPLGQGGVDGRQSGRKHMRSVAFRSREHSRILASGDELLDEVHAAPIETGLDLLPGERVVLGHEKGGPWYTATLPVSLPPPGRSVMVREFDVLDARDLTPFHPEGLVREGTGGERSPLRSEGDPGRLVVPLDHAYPILDGNIEVVPADPSGAGVELDLARGRDSLTSIPPVAVSDDGTRHFRLRRMLLRAQRHDAFSIVLRVPLGAVIERVRVFLVCQIATGALPVFTTGKNAVRLVTSDPPEGEHRLRLSVHHSRRDSVLPAPAIEAVHPAPGAVVDRALPELRWRVAGLPTDAHPGPFHVVVAHDRQMRHVVASNFDREVGSPQLALDDEDRSFLESGRTYYWRVRTAGRRTGSSWDEPAPFSFRTK